MLRHSCGLAINFVLFSQLMLNVFVFVPFYWVFLENTQLLAACPGGDSTAAATAATAVAGGRAVW